MSRGRIFISYRRTGGSEYARGICGELVQRRYDVFLDVDSLESGPFKPAILKEIRECRDFVVVLSPNALDRCDAENDWLSLEIAEAVLRGKNIVPLFHPQFQWPEKTLPSQIQSLDAHQRMEIRLESFTQDMQTCCRKFLRSRPKWRWPQLAVAVIVLVASTALASVWMNSHVSDPWNGMEQYRQRAENVLDHLEWQDDLIPILQDWERDTLALKDRTSREKLLGEIAEMRSKAQILAKPAVRDTLKQVGRDISEYRAGRIGI